MNETQHAFLLHSRPYKEHQLIIDLLTKEDGKVSAVISSGHSLKSNKKAILQPFSLFSLQLNGRHQLRKASGLESCHQTYSLVGKQLYSGLYLNELLVRLLPELVPCPELFRDYKAALEELNQGVDVELVLRRFEMKVLDELGIAFNFEQLNELTTSHVQFLVEQGFCDANPSIKLPVYEKNHLLAIERSDYSDKHVLTTHKFLMRQVLNHLLGHKPLKSRELFKARDIK